MKPHYVEVTIKHEEWQRLCEMNDAYRRAAKAADAHREAQAVYDKAIVAVRESRHEAEDAKIALDAAVEAYRIQLLSR